MHVQTLAEMWAGADSVNPSPASLRIDGRRLGLTALADQDGCLVCLFDAPQTVNIALFLTLDQLRLLADQLTKVS